MLGVGYTVVVELLFGDATDEADVVHVMVDLVALFS